MTQESEVQFSDAAVAQVVDTLQHRAHEGAAAWQSIPGFEVAACGAGFAQQGLKIAAALEGVRSHGQSMYAGLAQFAPAVHQQWREFADVEQLASHSVRALAGEIR